MSFAEAAAALGLAVTAGEPLARHTTFRIGGPADLWAVAHDAAALARLAALAAEHGLPLTILGGGSNILVGDGGLRGLVIGNQARAWHMERGAPSAGQALVVAESGAPLAGLARWTLRQELSGLEWAVSVPGSVGGAVIGNAGAHGGQIADTLLWASVVYVGQTQGNRYSDNPLDWRLQPVSPTGRSDRPGSSIQAEVLELPAKALQFAYRSSILKAQLLQEAGAGAAGRPVVLSAAFALAPGDPAEMSARADAYLARRRASQPVEPSAGSVFRNPPGDHAGRLIEAAGLKGHQIGGALISPRHANFIVNAGGASAANVRALIRLVQETVGAQFTIRLEPEIMFIGDA